MQTSKTITVQQEQVDTIQCNACGTVYSADELDADGFEGLSAVVTGGYNSKRLGDMTEYRWDVCECCLVEWFKTFKVEVDRKDMW